MGEPLLVVAGTDRPAPPAATGPESNGAAADGAPGAAPLTPHQKRKQREAEEAQKAADRKAKRDAKAAGKRAEPAQAATTEPLDEDKAVKVLGVFVRFLFRVAKLLVYPFGGQLAPLTPTEVAEQAEQLIPYAVAFPGFYKVACWLAWPSLFLDLVVSKFSRRQTEAAP